jgi:hypothetical protein
VRAPVRAASSFSDQHVWGTASGLLGGWQFERAFRGTALAHVRGERAKARAAWALEAGVPVSGTAAADAVAADAAAAAGVAAPTGAAAAGRA